MVLDPGAGGFVGEHRTAALHDLTFGDPYGVGLHGDQRGPSSGVNRGPSPHVASLGGSGLGFRQVRPLAVVERPDFITFDPLGLHAPDGAIMVRHASLTGQFQKPEDRMLRSAGKPLDPVDRVSRHHQVKDLAALIEGKAIHGLAR